MVDGGGLENRWVNSPGGSNPSLSEFFSRKKEKKLVQERCPSGRRGLPAKQLYRLGTGGSNPPFSE